MSLLLDALKRAEQEKLAKQGEGAPEAKAPPAAAPAPAAAPTPAPASASILELQPLARPGAATGRADAQAAQAVFAAKAGESPKRSRRGAIWAMVAGIALVVLGGGGYLWYSLNALSPKTALRPAPLPPVPRPVAPAGLEQPASSTPSKAAAPGVMPAAETASASPAPAPAAAAAAAPPPSAPSPARAAPPPSREDVLAGMVRDAMREDPAAVKLAKSTEAPRVAPEISNGYEALRNGQLADARRAYAAAIASDPASADAVLGMATVEARSGNLPAAAALYRKVLDLDSRNPTALAGLASVADASRPEVMETQLRTDIARYPQSAGLQVALGNLFAVQGRWAEAQAAYFEAHRLDPAGADILFNLAVSLDRMGQPRVAAGYYRRAVEAARTQASQFDPAAAMRRLAEIQP